MSLSYLIVLVWCMNLFTIFFSNKTLVLADIVIYLVFNVTSTNLLVIL